mmetsp:Transcript_14092/g.10143  ORF Transcript_14092/g.10143 Transcript_14092/m.10143 type:complete len:83 (+) Transcript_14092:137-385(+)
MGVSKLALEVGMNMQSIIVPSKDLTQNCCPLCSNSRWARCKSKVPNKGSFLRKGNLEKKESELRAAVSNGSSYYSSSTKGYT